MKKILTIGNKILNHPLREAGYQVCSISDQKKLSHKDDILFPLYIDLNKTRETILKTVSRFKPDILFEIDGSRPLLFYDIEYLDVPKFWYTIDTHLHYNWHKHYAVLFDKVFCAQKNIAENFKQDYPHIEWLPLYFKGNPQGFNEWCNRSRKVSFVGTLNPKLNPERCSFFENLKKRIPELTAETGDFVPIYTDSKIVINQSVNNDLNYRFFEAAGCGALLINDRLTHSMDDILIPDAEYLFYEYGNVENCEEKIKWALNNEKTAENMAKKAFVKIQKFHSISNRTETIIQCMQKFNCKKTGNRRERLEHFVEALSYLTLLNYPEYYLNSYRKKIIEIQKELNNM